MDFTPYFNPVYLIILALAIYRLCRLAIEDTLFSGLRARFWNKFPPESTRIGYLLTCYWCLGFWIAAVVLVLYLLVPVPTLIGCTLLALSTMVGILDQKLSN